MASREAARVSSWDLVPSCSKSFSPRRGRVEFDRDILDARVNTVQSIWGVNGADTVKESPGNGNPGPRQRCLHLRCSAQLW